MFCLIQESWSIGCWHWIRDIKLHEYMHRYSGEGACVLATPRTAALNLLRVAGFVSILEGLYVVMLHIRLLLSVAMGNPLVEPSRNYESDL